MTSSIFVLYMWVAACNYGICWQWVNLGEFYSKSACESAKTSLGVNDSTPTSSLKCISKS